jgi:hypothetical protein
MLLMQVMPVAQQPPLQNVSEGKQQTCRGKHVASR